MWYRTQLVSKIVGRDLFVSAPVYSQVFHLGMNLDKISGKRNYKHPFPDHLKAPKGSKYTSAL
jgi:hypothetical protein